MGRWRRAALGGAVLLVGISVGVALAGLVGGVASSVQQGIVALRGDQPGDATPGGPLLQAGQEPQTGGGTGQGSAPTPGAEATKPPDPAATMPPAATPPPAAAAPTKPGSLPTPQPMPPAQAPNGLPPKPPGALPKPPSGALPPGAAPGLPAPPGSALPPMMPPPGAYGMPPGMPGSPAVPLTPPGGGPGLVPMPGMPFAGPGVVPPADVAYGPDPLQHLDVYPARRGTGPAPMLLFVHGGGWSIGDKSELSWLGAKLAEQGVLVAVANYRLSPAVQHPAHAQDVARAIAWLYRNGANYGGDPQRLYVGGHSAGAHLASLVALDDTYLGAEGLSTSVVRSVVGISGAGYDLDARYAASPLAQLFYAAFGKDPSRWALAAPLHYVDHGAPPFLLIHGLNDGEAPAAGAQTFAQALKRDGAQIRLELLPGLDHQAALLTALPSLLAFVQ